MKFSIRNQTALPALARRFEQPFEGSTHCRRWTGPGLLLLKCAACQRLTVLVILNLQPVRARAGPVERAPPPGSAVCCCPQAGARSPELPETGNPGPAHALFLPSGNGNSKPRLPGNLAGRQASGQQDADLASSGVGRLEAASAHNGSPWLLMTRRLSSARWPFATRRHPTGCCTSEGNWGLNKPAVSSALGP